MTTSLSRFMAPRVSPGNSAPLATVATVATVASPEARYRLWLIHHRDGRLLEHSFTPPATAAEVSAWYPGAAIEAVSP